MTRFASMRLLPAVLAALLLSPPANAEEVAPRWSSDVVDLFSELPIQSAGRVKPLYTWATYSLLRMNGGRACRTAADQKVGAIEWLLDALFRPEVARTHRCFQVDTNEVVDAIGVEVEGRRKRDRYSYDEIVAGRERLRELAEEYGRKSRDRRSAVEGGLVDLWASLRSFETLLGLLDFARGSISLPDDESVRAQFEGAAEVAVSEVAKGIPVWLEAHPDARAQIGALVAEATGFAEGSQRLTLLPPTPEQSEQLRALEDRRLREQLHPEAWLSPVDVVARSALTPAVRTAEAHVEMLRLLERMAAAAKEPDAFRDAATQFSDKSRALSEERGFRGKVLGLFDRLELEVRLRRFRPFLWAQWLFVAAFLLVAVSWVWRTRWLDVGTWTLLAVGLLLVTLGIVARSLILERPPVVSLYDTIVFITWISVVTCLIAEWIKKSRIALAFAPILGALLLMVAAGYEGLKAKDTLEVLPAVLDTDFWLATHVTTIAIGYGASVVAAAIAHLYVLGRVFGYRKDDSEFYRDLSRTTYGVVAFALIFSVVGTILGGIWANDAWGRFWGWDPKENGALMIVLWQLAMLHARLGGHVKAFGFNLAAILLIPVVSFSWWGVNLLGVGMHTYGFVQGVWTALFVVYGIEFAVIIAGTGWRLGWAWPVTALVLVNAEALGAWLVTGDITALAWTYGGAFVLGQVGLGAWLLSRRYPSQWRKVCSTIGIDVA